MRTFLILAMFAASLADAALGSYEESRDLTLDAAGGWGNRPTVRLDVRVPARIGLQVRDGSGSLKYSDIRGRVETEGRN